MLDHFAFTPSVDVAAQYFKTNRSLEQCVGGSLWAAADHWRVVPGRLLSGPMGKEDGVARLVMGGQMLKSISGVASERIKCLGL